MERLNHSHSGNLSVRKDDTVLITKSGSQLGFLSFSDIVELNIHSTFSGKASMEYPVHRSIYLSNNCGAVVHCHPPVTVSLSLGRDEIRPIDAEGRYYFDKVPVYSAQNAIASDEVAGHIPPLFKESPVVVVRGHGIFSIGKDLEEAYKYASSLEASSHIIWFTESREAVS